jgi:DNA-binding MarR family transcriptional regulator
MHSNDFRLANETWNLYYRAQATLAREFADNDIWEGLIGSEYAVLYALSVAPDGLRVTELHDDVLITQPGMSRLIARLVERELVQRREDDDDARARRICLTSEGLALQRRVGAAHARHIAAALGRALDTDQLTALRDASRALLDSAQQDQTRQKEQLS